VVRRLGELLIDAGQRLVEWTVSPVHPRHGQAR
jgi:hypothetical protein